MSKENVSYMDVAKGLGIITVVLGHARSPLAPFIFLFHMPLFFFISGYFYKESYSCQPALLIRKRIKSLYLPYLKYEILFVLLHNIFFTLGLYHQKYQQMYDLNQFMKTLAGVFIFKVGEPLLVPFWFFGSLFLTNVLFSLISFIAQKYTGSKSEWLRFAIIIFCFMLGNLLTARGMTIPRFNTAIVALLIYYLGVNFKKYEARLSVNGFIALPAFLVLLINSHRGFINMMENQYSSPAFLIINSIAGIYLTLYVSQKLLNIGFLSKLLQYAGNSTIIIMALHFISFKAIMLIQIMINGLPMDNLALVDPISPEGGWWMAYSMAGVTLPLLIKYVMDTASLKIRSLEPSKLRM